MSEIYPAVVKEETTDKKQSLREKIGFKLQFSSVKHTFLEWSEKVDINCYTKMFEYKGNHYVQCIWFVILLLSTGATFFLIAKNITDYLTYEVTSQIRIINELPTQFPTVTFCDNNPFSSLKQRNLCRIFLQLII
jgi:hypothetical protein